MNFAMFNKISDWMGNTKLLNNLSKEKKSLDIIYKKFFIIEDYIFCYKMIDEGYRVNNYQKKELDSLSFKKFYNFSYLDIKNINSVNKKLKMRVLFSELELYPFNLQVGLDFINKNFNGDKREIINYNKEFLKEYKEDYNKGLDIKNNYHLEKMIGLNKVLIKSNLLKLEDVEEIIQDFKDTNNYILKQRNSKNQIASFNAIRKEYIDSIIIELVTFSLNMDKNNINIDKEEVLQRIKNNNLKNKPLLLEVKDLIKNEEHSIKELPNEAQKKIKKLQDFIIISNDIKTINLINESLSNILKKYLSVDKEYRESLRNVQGLNAEQLMIQSLENLEIIINSSNKEKNKKSLIDLSIQTRVLKTKNL